MALVKQQVFTVFYRENGGKGEKKSKVLKHKKTFTEVEDYMDSVYPDLRYYQIKNHWEDL